MDIWVYMLRCADGSYYVGLTREGLDKRLSEHRSGRFLGYTHGRRPVLSGAITVRCPKDGEASSSFDRLR